MMPLGEVSVPFPGRIKHQQKNELMSFITILLWILFLAGLAYVAAAGVRTMRAGYRNPMNGFLIELGIKRRGWFGG